MAEGSSHDQGSQQERILQRLVDAAEAFAPTLDLKRNPSAHISAALRGIKDGAERDRLFGAIRRELNKRLKAEQVRRARELEDLDDADEQRMMREAHAHQMRQPRDAWDPKAGEDDE